MRDGPATLAIRVVPTGVRMPPPRPCRQRKAISSPAEVAVAHSTEPVVKITTAVSQTRRAPYRSPSHPEIGMTDARARV